MHPVHTIRKPTTAFGGVWQSSWLVAEVMVSAVPSLLCVVGQDGSHSV
jgi:hypothetical protein